MLSPIWSGKQNRSDEEVAEWERQQAKLNQDYESPWLSGLVTFSGFVAAFIGSVAVIFLATWFTAQGGCRTRSSWPDWWARTCACALCVIRGDGMQVTAA